MADFKTDFTFNRDAFGGQHSDTMPALFDTRYTLPPAFRDVEEELLKYDDAAALAKAIVPGPGSRHFAILNGSFIFGDFIEALLVEHNAHLKELTISTLSLSENNVDSLRNLLTGGYVDKLNLILSAYQHSHELHNLVPYLLEQLDIDNRFQYAAAGTHCKLCLMESHSGLKFTLHGSANLRTSGNIEQFMLEEGAALYDFNMDYQRRILARYSVINHDKPLPKTTPLRGTALWHQVHPSTPAPTPTAPASAAAAPPLPAAPLPAAAPISSTPTPARRTTSRSKRPAADAEAKQ